MATFIPLVFPATWLIEQTGLRNIALLGSFINMLGSGEWPYKCKVAVKFQG